MMMMPQRKNMKNRSTLGRKAFFILLNAIPVFIMIGLIQTVRNDYLLAGLYALIIGAAFLVKYEKMTVCSLCLDFSL